MIDLTQAEADILLSMEKCRLNDDLLRCQAPIDFAWHVAKAEA